MKPRHSEVKKLFQADTEVAEPELEPTLGGSTLHELNRYWRGMRGAPLVKSLTNHCCRENPRYSMRRQQEITNPRATSYSVV